MRDGLIKTETEQGMRESLEMCDKEHPVGNKKKKKKCVFIRPTGNPLDRDGWNKMMTNEDVNVESSRLVQMNRLRISENMAYVCYTTHGKFTYKGTENDDVAVFTSILEKLDGRWQVVFGQRSTGRKPSDTPPKFP